MARSEKTVAEKEAILAQDPERYKNLSCNDPNCSWFTVMDEWDREPAWGRLRTHANVHNGERQTQHGMRIPVSNFDLVEDKEGSCGVIQTAIAAYMKR